MTFCSHPRENGDPDSRGDPHALRAGDDVRHFRGNDNYVIASEKSLQPPGEAVGGKQSHAGPFGSLRIIGQAAASYIICEREDALVVIDQHAAHERVKFERLRSQYEKGEVESQLLLVSEIIELSRGEVSELLEKKGIFNGLGWEIDSFGSNSVVIKSVPAILGASNLRSAISSLFSDLLAISSESKLELPVQRVLATTACHAAIRFNQSLSTEEMKRLLMELDNVELISNCPHGRPIVTEIPFKKLSTLFHRA